MGRPVRCARCQERSGVILLLGSMAGLLVSAVLLVVGLRSGDRWLAVTAVVAAVAFMGAVVLFGVAL